MNFIKVSTIVEVLVNFSEHTATMSPILFIIKAIEMVKTHSNDVGQSEADAFAILHEKGQPVYLG